MLRSSDKRNSMLLLSLRGCPQYECFWVFLPQVAHFESCFDDILLNCSFYRLSFTIFAGKVHGSLSRAGKVRGQTPKVAKQDKKKKSIMGRAKKRQQYNKRYVNVVVGPGGKRVGPNSQAEKIRLKELALRKE